uniref:Uncharacterized protein n=1 Tax=Tetraselmis sp. GSL018 TaxID=582737 RepID=A0A061S226_9CHLO
MQSELKRSPLCTPVKTASPQPFSPPLTPFLCELSGRNTVTLRSPWHLQQVQQYPLLSRSATRKAHGPRLQSAMLAPDPWHGSSPALPQPEEG